MLDSILLPYYKGSDALVSTTFSGKCSSCACRNEMLIILVPRGGDQWPHFQLWVLSVEGLSADCGKKTGTTILIRPWLESIAWILTFLDSVYLATNSTQKVNVESCCFWRYLFWFAFMYSKGHALWQKKWHSVWKNWAKYHLHYREDRKLKWSEETNF